MAPRTVRKRGQEFVREGNSLPVGIILGKTGRTGPARFVRRMRSYGASLPEEVSCNELPVSLCQRLIAPDPARRFADAQAADPDPAPRPLFR